jgi:hypothetical protein
MRKGKGQVKVRRIRRPHIIDSRPTGRLGIALLLLLVALGSWGYLALDLAQEERAPAQIAVAPPPAQSPEEVDQLERQRATLAHESAELEQQLRILTKNRQAESEAVLQAQSEIRQLQSENAQLRSQVAFLSQLFGGDDGPIDISDLALSRADESSFRYWFKVSRTNAGDNMLTGQVRIQVRGRLDNEERYFSLSDLSADDRDGHRLGFRHFQEIDGTLELPQNFVPEELLVIVVPDDKATGGARRQFEWRISQDAN